VRRGTLIAVIVLFVLLIGAAAYQFTLGGGGKEPFCGPASPGAQPSPGVCLTTPAITPTTP
jgi:hypothetical protein